MILKAIVYVEVESRRYLMCRNAKFKQRHAYLTKHLQTNLPDHYDSSSRITKADVADYAWSVSKQVAMRVVLEMGPRA